MTRRSKRELAPPSHPFPTCSPSGGMSPTAPPGSSGPRCFPTPPALMKSTPASTAPGPWWCGPPVSPQGMPAAACTWWPAPSYGGGAAASSSKPVQKDDIDSDPNEWGGDNHPPGGFLSFFNNPWTPPLPQTIPPHLVSRSRGKKSQGMSGSNNDINVLNQSPLFIEALKGKAPQVQFSVNGRQYNTRYYLADGIYPEWAAFVKSIKEPQMEKHKLYALKQEGCRKDIERAFGVLQSRFNIVRRPSRLWKRKSIGRIMKACVILHNMIVEDEKEMVKFPIDLNEQGGSSIALPPEVQKGGGPIFSEILCRRADIHHQPTHKQLKKDLIEHIWQKFADKRNN